MGSKSTKSEIQERLDALQEISVELMTSRTLGDTLTLIVNKAVDLLLCDGGSLYLKSDKDLLVFEVAVNRSVAIDFRRQMIPIDSQGLAAYSFRTGQSLNLRDVQEIGPEDPYCFDDSFDRAMTYRTRSVLTQPLKSSKGEKLGVIQLINRKRSRQNAWPSTDAKQISRMPLFDEDDARLLESFAAVASAAIEKAQLYRDIENLFEGFVKASVQAIEARDLTTRGHSDRVAVLTVALAEHVSRSQEPALRDLYFNDTQLAEIRYASLLHDFGKIGVKESTLQKQEKLSLVQRLEIELRFERFKRASETQVLREYINRLLKDAKAPNQLEIARIERQIRDFGLQIDDYWRQILALNRPAVMDGGEQPSLDQLAQISHLDCEGHSHSLLAPTEIQSLRILRGSLTKEERIEIESHVVHTYEFLRKIPWTRELARVPEIAYAHHERLNGTGYPRGVLAPEIPFQSRMMAICDVFDALVASDRPYKQAIPVAKALDILDQEAKRNQLDPSFLKVFVEARIYELAEFTDMQKLRPKKAA